MRILTCKLGNEIINCYDGTHNKEQLKKWAKKKILICPACGKAYEYCHGQVKTPYFRHMDKNECEDRFSESETEEHLNGKRDLFEWIKKQNGVTNAILEGWLPETKQRPDIIFDYNGKKYVIEYQCSPIASEYIERHELYQAAGINDIWILGTDKYLMLNMREKFIQKHSIGFYDSLDNFLILLSYNNIQYFKPSKSLRVRTYSHNNGCFYGLKLKDFLFQDSIVHSQIGDLEIAMIKKQKRNNTRQMIIKKNSGEYTEKVEKIINKVNISLKRNFPYSLNRYNLKGTEGYKDIYLGANDLIRICNLKSIISAYDNSKWHMTIKLNHNKNKYELIAFPKTFGFYESDIFETKTLKSIDLISYCNDIECLKDDLLELMKINFNKALDYKDNNMRILEVRN